MSCPRIFPTKSGRSCIFDIRGNYLGLPAMHTRHAIVVATTDLDTRPKQETHGFLPGLSSFPWIEGVAAAVRRCRRRSVPAVASWAGQRVSGSQTGRCWVVGEQGQVVFEASTKRSQAIASLPSALHSTTFFDTYAKEHGQ